MKQTLIWFNIQRDGTGNGLPNIKDMFAERLQLQMSALHQSICIFKAGLSSSCDCWAKYKEKVPDVSDPNQNAETISNSSLYNLKIYSSNKCRKTSQRWIILYVTVANTAAILNIWIFSWRYHFRLWVFASTGKYFYYWHWRDYPICYKVNDAKTFKNLVPILFFAYLC